MECISAVTQRISEVILYSGHYIQRIGSYDTCVSTSEMAYNLILFADNQTRKQNGMFVSLCLPTVCSPDYINLTLTTLINVTQTPLMVSQIRNNVDMFLNRFSWVFFLTIGLFIAVFLLMVISTLFQKHTKKIVLINSFNIKDSLKIFERKNSPLNVLNGVRALSMMWVVFGHQLSFEMTNAVNAQTIQNQVQNYSFLFAEGALFAVDIFFFLGGFLVIYTLMRSQINSLMKYPLAILHRALRIWPSYIVAILIYYSIFMHLGHGPFWYQMQDVVNDCSTMWKPLLFVDNFMEGGQKQCLAWGWYIQNDMQIFIFCMFILSISIYSLRCTKILTIVFLALSVIYIFMQVMINQYVVMTHIADFQKWGDYYSDLYVTPWARCSPYLYGILLGIAFVQYQKNIKNTSSDKKLSLLQKLKLKCTKSRKFRIGCQLGGFAVMLFIIVIPRTLQVGYKWPTVLHAFYLSISKLLIVIALSLILVPSMLGMNTFIRFSLDTTLFNFIAKVSFCTYLVHVMFIFLLGGAKTIDFYYTQMNMISFYFTHLALSISFGFLLTMFIEVPFSKIEKHYIGILQNKFKQKKSEQKQELMSSQLHSSLEGTLKINKQ